MLKKTPFFLTVLLITLSNVVFAQSANIKEFFIKGQMAYNQGNYPAAAEALEQAIKVNSDFAPAYNTLGLTYKEMNKNLSEVIWYFKTAVEIDPKFIDAYENLSKAYYGLGQFDNAEKYSLQALEIDPGSTKLKLSLAWIYLLGKNKPKEAIKYFEEVLAKVDIPNAYFGMGLAYFMSGNRSAVLDVITKLRETNQNQLALQLEDIIRGSEFKDTTPAGNPFVNTTPTEVSAPPPDTADAMMRVRLRGKMDDAQNTSLPITPEN